MNLPPFQHLLDAHGADLHRFCVAQAGPAPRPGLLPGGGARRRCGPTPTSRTAANLRGWLFTIAHRKVIDHHRATARRPVPVGDVPERRRPMRHRWRRRAVGGGGRSCPDKQRGAIALRYLGDLPYAEIAAVLECSEAAARQNVRAGLASLRQEVTR